MRLALKGQTYSREVQLLGTVQSLFTLFAKSRRHGLAGVEQGREGV